jgi:hypothetical protein
MELTTKELIKYYKYVYLYMNISAYKNYLFELINKSDLCDKDFYINIFNDYKFFNNPDFEGLTEIELYNVYKNIETLKSLYDKIQRTYEKRLKEAV